MPDYRTLLMKYICHIDLEEGIDFVSGVRRKPPNWITPEEWEELKKLAAESEEHWVREDMTYKF